MNRLEKALRKQSKIYMTGVRIPRDMGAWLSWQAKKEHCSMNDIFNRLLREYHARCSAMDHNTPYIEPEEKKTDE